MTTDNEAAAVEAVAQAIADVVGHGMAEKCEAQARAAIAAHTAASGGLEGTTHPDDVAVYLFAEAMKAKLEYCRTKRGRYGWNDKDDCTQELLSNLLRDHVDKGDPVDVANFACFLWNRKERIAHTAASAGEAVAPEEVHVRIAKRYVLCDLQETTFDDLPLYHAREPAAVPADALERLAEQWEGEVAYWTISAEAKQIGHRHAQAIRALIPKGAE